MNAQPQEETRVEDITLVNFVVLLIKQWKVMAVFLLLSFLITIVVSFFKPERYDFATIYSVASFETNEGVRRGLETPEEVIAKIDNIFLEQQRRALLSSENIDSLPFEIITNNPNNTLLLRVVSRAQEKHQPLIERFHEGLVGAIQEDQKSLVETLTENLQYQSDSYSQALDVVQDADSERATELEAVYFEKVFQLDRRISSISEGVSSQLAVRSLEPTGFSTRASLLIGFVLALLITPLVGFLSIFVKKLKIAYRNYK